MLSVNEQIQQIRVTHLALLGLTFSLFIVSLERDPKEYEKALGQARDIVSATLEWNPSFLDIYAHSELSKLRIPESFRSDVIVSTDIPGHASVHFKFPERSWTLHPLPKELSGRDKSYDDRFVQYQRYIQLKNNYLVGKTFVPAPTTLKAFSETWDALGAQLEIRKSIDVGEKCFVHRVHGKKPAAWQSVKIAKSTDRASSQPLRSMNFRSRTDYEATFFASQREFDSNKHTHFFTGGLVLSDSDPEFSVGGGISCDR